MENIENLPSWATFNEETNKIEVDPDNAYPAYIDEMGLERDKYGAEVARRCMIKDLILICGPVSVRILRNNDWRLSNLPGDDRLAELGANEFRRHYDKLMNKRARSVLIP